MPPAPTLSASASGSCISGPLTAPDPEDVLCLQRRIRELMPLRRQARELAYHTAHYYDRGCHRYAAYRI